MPAGPFPLGILATGVAIANGRSLATYSRASTPPDGARGPDTDPQEETRVATGFVSLLTTTLLAATAIAQDPAAAKAWLEEGNRRFQQGEASPARLDAGARRTAATRPEPRAIVLTCCDADVPPEHLFQAGLGELVVLRLAGPSVDAESLADVERAADGLRVPLLVVLAHDHCSAAGRAVHLAGLAAKGAPGTVPSAAVQQLLQQFEPSVRSGLQAGLSGDELTTHVETDRAIAVAAECLRRSETLRRLQRLGRFQSWPARYTRATGAVEWLVPRTVDTTPQEVATVVEAEPPSMAPHVALRLLQAGNRRYLGNGKPLGDVSPARREKGGESQPPFAMVLACSDARVPPEHLFDCGLGELAVVRTAGPSLGEAALASLELTSSTTGAPLLVVLGHVDCTALAEAARPADPARSENTRALVDRVAPSVDGRGADARAVAAANALRTTAALRQRSALLQRLEDEGRLLLIPALYDVATGDVEWLAESLGAKRPMAKPAAPHGESHGDPHGQPAHDGHGDAHAAPGHGDDGHGQAAAHSAHGDDHGHGSHGETPATSGHEPATGNAHGDPHAAGPGEGSHGAHGSEPAAPQTHGSAHGDPGHGDSGHGDEAHGETAHGDSTHGQPAHGESAKGESAHGSGGHEQPAHDADGHGNSGHDAPPAAPHGETAGHAAPDLSWAKESPLHEPPSHTVVAHGPAPQQPSTLGQENAAGGSASPFGGKQPHWTTVAMIAVTAIASFALALVVTAQKRG